MSMCAKPRVHGGRNEKSKVEGRRSKKESAAVPAVWLRAVRGVLDEFGLWLLVGREGLV